MSTAASAVSPSASLEAGAPLRIAPARWAVVGSFAIVYLVWGSTFLGIRVAVETISPLTMSAIRFLIAGSILMLAASRVRPRATLRQWGNAVLIGGLFFLFNHGFVSSAARHIPSSLTCLIIATEVPIIALLSSVLLPNQPLTRRGLFGAALGLCGVAVLFVGQGSTATSASVWACLAVLGASMSWGLGAVLSQRLDLPSDALLRAAMQMFCGGVLLAIAAFAKGEPALSLAAVSTRSMVAFAYLIVFGSVITFACYSFLLKHVRTDAVATHVFVNPLVAVAVGAWLGNEKLLPAHFVAGLFILGSVCVITLGQPRKEPAE